MPRVPGRNTNSCLPAIMRSTTSRSPRTGRSCLMTALTARRSSRYLKPSPPQALNARRTTARNCPPKKNPKPSTLCHRTKLWGLRWKSRWTRWRLATSPSYWTPRAVSSKRRSAWTLCLSRFRKTGWHSPGSRNCRTLMRSKPTPISFPHSAR